MPFAAEVAKGKIKSKAQARAMFAAAEGHSTLGIPQSVGKEMTAGTGHGAHKGIEKGFPEHAKAPFHKVRGRAAEVARPGHKLKRDHGPTAGASLNMGGTGGQGNTAFKAYKISNP